MFLSFFFFNDTATTEIYTLSLHDALPILRFRRSQQNATDYFLGGRTAPWWALAFSIVATRSEEHTSELQSQSNLVCRLLLEKKKNTHKYSLHARSTALPDTLAMSYI